MRDAISMFQQNLTQILITSLGITEKVFKVKRSKVVCLQICEFYNDSSTHWRLLIITTDNVGV